jgi:hypothetical protein
MDQAFGISDKLWAYDTATMLWARITLVPHSYTQVNQVWDGSSYTQSFTGSLASKRIMPHLGYSAARNLLFVSKGYSTQDTVWLALNDNWSIDLTTKVMKEIIEDSLLFNANDIFSGCFAFEPTRKLYIEPVQINAESTIYNQNCKPFKSKIS